MKLITLRFILLIQVILLIRAQLQAQTYQAIEGTITFFSSAPLEDIEATNHEVSSLFQTQTGKIAFSVPNNEFQFEKSLMQQHFNEKYMESHQYPQSTFEGKISGYQPGLAGKQKVKASGTLSIHGVSQLVEVDGLLINNDSQINLEAIFPVKLKDYKIKIPKVLFHNIAEQVKVTVQLKYALHEPQ